MICHETIHRFIYTQVARTKDYRWGRLLPTGRTRQRYTDSAAPNRLVGRRRAVSAPKNAPLRKGLSIGNRPPMQGAVRF